MTDQCRITLTALSNHIKQAVKNKKEAYLKMPVEKMADPVNATALKEIEKFSEYILREIQAFIDIERDPE